VPATPVQQQKLPLSHRRKYRKQDLKQLKLSKTMVGQQFRRSVDSNLVSGKGKAKKEKQL